MKCAILHNMKICASKARSRNSFSCFRCGGGKIATKSSFVDPPLPERTNEENILQSPRSRARRLRSDSSVPCRPLREGSGSKFDLWHMLCSIGIPKNYDGTTGRFLLRTSAGRVADTKRKHNNQPNIHFNTCLGRVYLRCWWDWSAVALSVSHLVSGSFSSTRTQVDCFESLHIVQHFADGAETFAYEAHGYRPASCILVSCISAV